MRVLIQNGTVVSPWSRVLQDVLVEDEKIIGLGSFTSSDADTVIDATGKMVLPGGIDSHVHIDNPFAFMGVYNHQETFYTASVAAAIGGTTTLVDFTNVEEGESLIENYKARKEQALSQGTVIDFGLHVILGSTSDSIIKELDQLADMGCPSYKFYITYDGALNDGQVMDILKAAKKNRAIVGVHAENQGMASHNKQKCIERGETGWRSHMLSKDDIVEEEAIRRVSFLAEKMGVPLVIFHMTTAAGVEICKAAQARGVPLYSETCIHYLTFNDDVYDREDGYLYLISPPIKRQYNNDGLWEGVRNRTVSSVTTDHVAFDRATKLKNLKRDENGKLIPEYYLVVNGGPGIELRLPILLNGVSEGKLSWEQLVFANSYGAAKLFGLYPRKGLIEVGADADIVLVDPNKKMHITNDMLHMAVDYTLYEGLDLKGWPVLSMLRGKVIAQDGEFVGEKNYGQFLYRALDQEVFENPAWLKCNR